jgi:tetratricopeptide (TPR) repeat protein
LAGGDDDDATDLKVIISPAAQIDHLLAIGQVGRAKEIAAKQIADDPNEPSSYLALSRVLLREKKAEAAIAAAEEAVKLAPEWASAWSARSTALYVAGRFAAAEESIIRAIELEPDAPHLFENYARILQYCGHEAKALDLTQRALELDPDDENAHRMFAALLHSVKPSQWGVSEEAAQRALELDPEDSDNFAVLGMIKFSRRQYAEAEELFRTALELRPNNQFALRGLAQVMMSKHVLYRPFLAYALFMSRLGAGVQLMIVGSLWAFAQVLYAVTTSTWHDVVTIGYLALCAYTWFATPITRAILRRQYPWLV